MELGGRSAIVTGGAGGLGRHRSPLGRRRDEGGGIRPRRRSSRRSREGARRRHGGGERRRDRRRRRRRRHRRRTSLGGPCRCWSTWPVEVSAAGAPSGAGRDPHDKGSFVATMEMNAVGTFNVTRLVAAAMGEQRARRGRRARRGGEHRLHRRHGGKTGQVAYGAAKAAILGMTLPMARDLAPMGIRVCAIAPGTMGTPLMLGVPEHMKEGLVKGIVFPKRMGRPGGVRPAGRVDRAEPVPQRREHPARRRPALHRRSDRSRLGRRFRGRPTPISVLVLPAKLRRRTSPIAVDHQALRLGPRAGAGRPRMAEATDGVRRRADRRRFSSGMSGEE